MFQSGRIINPHFEVTSINVGDLAMLITVHGCHTKSSLRFAEEVSD
jgi:hypothetical protein